METIEVKISELKPAEYNPRSMDEKAVHDLEASLTEFGMVEPIVVNGNKARKNIIIGGHQRYFVLKKMGKVTIPVVYVDIADLKKEQELNLRLNKNLGHWDWDMLANFEEEMLKAVGFTGEELEVNFKLSEMDNLVETQDIDMESLNVISVDGPGAPRLKIRANFYFEHIEDLVRVKEFFKTNKEWELDIGKLLELIK